MFPYIIQGSNITVVIRNKPHSVASSHPLFNKLKDAIKENDWTAVENLVEPKKVFLNYGKGNVSVKGDTLYWKDQEMHNALAKRMVSMLQEGFPVEPLILFMENLMENPSRRAVQELYGFLEKNSLPITPDGYFLAYKKVRADYKDVHSGTFDNSVGNTLSMDRNTVDDVASNTCSTGLHFCSQEYLKHFPGERLMILKINPRDVVSIPVDYNNSKGRCCMYTVVGEVGVNEPEKAFTKTVHATDGYEWPFPGPASSKYHEGP